MSGLQEYYLDLEEYMLHVPILVVLLVMETFSILNCQLQEHAILHKSISGFKT